MPPSLKFKLLQTPRGITLGMAFLQLIKGGLSLWLVMLSASFFGAGIYRDAWVIAWSVQILIFKLIFGPINETFRAKFLQIKDEKGEKIALNSSFGLLLFFCLLSVFIAILFYAIPESLVSIFAPGYSSIEHRQIIGEMLQYLMPTLIFSHVITLFVALLNTFKTFFLPEIFGIFSVLANIVLLYLFADSWGIYTLVVANYFSAIILVGLLVYNLIKRGYFPESFQFKFEHFKPFLLFALPLYLFYSAAQVNSWAERIIVSYLKVGNSSALDYARKFIDFPNSVIFILATSVMTPMLANSWLKNKNDIHFQKDFFVMLRTCILIISPIILLFSVCPNAIIELLLHRGKFTTEWVQPIAQTLFWFGIGLIGNVFFIICGQLLLVQQRAKLYAIMGALAQLLPVLFNFLFVQKLGIQVFGISWFVSQLFFGILMLWQSKVYNKKELLGLFQFIALSISAILLSYFSNQFFTDISDFSTIVLSAIFYFFYFIIMMILFGFDEIKSIKNLLIKKETLD